LNIKQKKKEKGPHERSWVPPFVVVSSFQLQGLGPFFGFNSQRFFTQNTSTKSLFLPNEVDQDMNRQYLQPEQNFCENQLVTIKEKKKLPNTYC
jgi:hypothetical protein